MTVLMVVMGFLAGIVVGTWITWDLLRHRTAAAQDVAWLRGYEQAQELVGEGR
jgi:hypothetical protein